MNVREMREYFNSLPAELDEYEVDLEGCDCVGGSTTLEAQREVKPELSEDRYGEEAMAICLKRGRP